MKNYKEILTREFLIQKWVIERLSQKEIANLLKIHVGTIEHYIRKLGLIGYRERQKYPIDESKIDYLNPVFWYMVGLLISDGHINSDNNRLMFSLTEDEDILLELSNYFSPSFYKIPIHKKKSSNGSTIYSLYLTSNNLVKEMLILLNTTQKTKTHDVSVPEAPNELCGFMLLRGIIDGDGSIKYTTSGNIFFELYSHSPKLIQGFNREYTKWTKEVLKLYSVKNKSGKSFNSDPTGTALIRIYQDYPKIAIQRKRNKIKTKVDDIVHRYEMINRNNW